MGVYGRSLDPPDRQSLRQSLRRMLGRDVLRQFQRLDPRAYGVTAGGGVSLNRSLGAGRPGELLSAREAGNAETVSFGWVRGDSSKGGRDFGNILRIDS